MGCLNVRRFPTCIMYPAYFKRPARGNLVLACSPSSESSIHTKEALRLVLSLINHVTQISRNFAARERGPIKAYVSPKAFSSISILLCKVRMVVPRSVSAIYLYHYIHQHIYIQCMFKDFYRGAKQGSFLEHFRYWLNIVF